MARPVVGGRAASLKLTQATGPRGLRGRRLPGYGAVRASHDGTTGRARHIGILGGRIDACSRGTNHHWVLMAACAPSHSDTDTIAAGPVGGIAALRQCAGCGNRQQQSGQEYGAGGGGHE